MIPKAYLNIVLFTLLFTSQVFDSSHASGSPASRKEWLCAHVRLMSSRYPYSNVVGFADGEINVHNLSSLQTAAFPDDCRQKNTETRLPGKYNETVKASSYMKGQRSSTKSAKLLMLADTIHPIPFGRSSDCMHFRIMAFENGTFLARGSEDDNCFIGKLLSQSAYCQYRRRHL